MKASHIISQDKTLLDALIQINSLKSPEPLVLFVIDEQSRMIGTLTDGDTRRALIRNLQLKDVVSTAMHRDFNYIREDVGELVNCLRQQKEKKNETCANP